ncbi:MAG: GxxExxY protein [Acidobacteriota bacterium]|nr:GxxExxY protein [Acidobacteriota bacterium]
MEGPRIKTRKEILFADEVFQVIGAAMEVHRALGCGFLEAVYQEALAIEFQERGIPFETQVTLGIHYKQHKLMKRYLADFVVFRDIIVELKSMDALTSRETAQLLNYLHATNKVLGLLINFESSGKLEWKRIAHTNISSRSF